MKICIQFRARVLLLGVTSAVTLLSVSKAALYRKLVILVMNAGNHVNQYQSSLQIPAVLHCEGCVGGSVWLQTRYLGSSNYSRFLAVKFCPSTYVCVWDFQLALL